MNNGKLLPVMFLVAMALVTWDEVARQSHVPPWPQRYATGGLAFLLLGIVEAVAAPLGGVLAIGLVLALAFKATGSPGADDTESPDPTAAEPGTVIVAL